MITSLFSTHRLHAVRGRPGLLQAIARAISRWEPFSERFLSSYFKTLRYEFGEPYRRGLLEYYRMAKALREIGAVPRLEFFNVGEDRSFPRHG